MWKHNYEHLENGTPCFISCTVHIWCHTMFCAPHFNASREIQRMSVAKHIPLSFACINSMQSFMFSMVKAKPNAMESYYDHYVTYIFVFNPIFFSFILASCCIFILSVEDLQVFEGCTCAWRHNYILMWFILYSHRSNTVELLM